MFAGLSSSPAARCQCGTQGATATPRGHRLFNGRPGWCLLIGAVDGAGQDQAMPPGRGRQGDIEDDSAPQAKAADTVNALPGYAPLTAGEPALNEQAEQAELVPGGRLGRNRTIWRSSSASRKMVGQGLVVRGAGARRVLLEFAAAIGVCRCIDQGRGWADFRVDPSGVLGMPR